MMVCTKGNTNRECCFFWGWIDAIDPIDAIDAIADMGFWGCELGGMEENKKSGGGDVRASPFRGTVSGIKPENSFSALSPLSPTVARCARHSHPSPPEKKAASRKKSRLRRKKTSATAKNGASCVSRVIYPPPVSGLPQPTLRGSWLWLRQSPSCALGFASLAHNMPSPTAAGLRRGAGAYLWHAEAWGVWNIFCNFVSWNETNNFFLI